LRVDVLSIGCRTNELVLRLQAAQSSSSFFQAQIRQRIGAHSKLVESLAQVDHNFTNLNQGGSLHQVNVAVEMLNKSTIDDFQNTMNSVFSQTISSTDELDRESGARLMALQTTLNAVHKSVQDSRALVSTQWSNYLITASNDTLLRPIAAFENGVAKVHEVQIKSKDQDPYIWARRYSSAIDKLDAEQQDYSNKVGRSFEDIRLLEGRRIDALKSTLLDYLLAEKAILQARSKCTDAALAAVSAVNSASDVQDWIARHDGALGASAASNSDVFSVPPENAEHEKQLQHLFSREIIREGDLGQFGSFFTFRVSEVSALLTSNGFLHVFANDADLEPQLSLNVQNCRVAANPTAGRFCFTIEQPNDSFFSISGSPHTYTFKCSDDAEMQAWIEDIQSIHARACLSPSPQASPTARGAAKVQIDNSFALALEASDFVKAVQVADQMLRAAPLSDHDAVTSFLCAVLELHQATMLPFLDHCVAFDVQFAQSADSLFLDDSLAWRFIRFFLHLHAQSWLRACIQSCVLEVVAASEAEPPISLDIDPARVDPSVIPEHAALLESCVYRLLAAINSSSGSANADLRQFVKLFVSGVDSKFANHGKQVICFVLFRRLVSPALVAPQKHGLVGASLSSTACNGLSLIASVMNHLADGESIAETDALAPLNSLLQQNSTCLSRAIDALISE
jgi:hypothetical protein